MPRRCSAISAPTSSRVEAPEGDTTRYTGPRRSADMASLFMGVNRNKRSIVLDLKQAAAREVLLRLVDTADVFVHNIRPQKLDKLGLGHADALLARHPRLIYAGIHGWREDGPYSGRPAYDDIIQGLCGRRAPDGPAHRRAALRADHPRRQDLRARRRRRRSSRRSTTARRPAAASSSKSRCSRPWWRSSWSSTCTAAASCPSRAGGLCARAGAVAAAVPHRRRLRLHAGLHRRAMAALLGRGRQARDDARPALRRSSPRAAATIDDVYRLAGEQIG